jgi:hypothetical protein
LRMRWRASELHRCEGCRGKQHEAKFCHDDLGLQENLGKKCRCAEPVGCCDQQPAIRPDCGGLQTQNSFISFMQRVARAPFISHSGGASNRNTYCPLRHVGRGNVIGAIGASRGNRQRRGGLECSLMHSLVHLHHQAVFKWRQRFRLLALIVGNREADMVDHRHLRTGCENSAAQQ